MSAFLFNFLIGKGPAHFVQLIRSVQVCVGAWVRVCVCACVRDRDRERGGKRGREEKKEGGRKRVREGEREREGQIEIEKERKRSCGFPFSHGFRYCCWSIIFNYFQLLYYI